MAESSLFNKPAKAQDSKKARNIFLAAAAAFTLAIAVLACGGGYMVLKDLGYIKETTSTTSTTTTTTTSSTTTTIEAPTTTTVPPTTKKATTTTAPKTTTTQMTSTTVEETTTTTTVSGIECSSSMDCGEIQNYLMCSNNNVLNFTITPQCRGGECVNRQKYETVDICETGKTCINESCVRVVGTTLVAPSTSTSTSIRFTMLTTTTTMVVPDATFCWSRTYARNQADCDNLRCPKGSCVYQGEGAGGHCGCAY